MYLTWITITRVPKKTRICSAVVVYHMRYRIRNWNSSSIYFACSKRFLANSINLVYRLNVHSVLMLKFFFFKYTLSARIWYVCRIVSCACNRYRSPTSKIILNTPRSRHGRKNRRRNHIIKITSVYYPPALMKTKLLHLARPYGRNTNNYETYSFRDIDNNMILLYTGENTTFVIDDHTLLLLCYSASYTMEIACKTSVNHQARAEKSTTRTYNIYVKGAYRFIYYILYEPNRS